MQKYCAENSKLFAEILVLALLLLLSACAPISQTKQVSLQDKNNKQKGIEWKQSLNEAVEIAKADNKSLMLVFYVSFSRLDKIFSYPDIAKLAQEFVCLKLGSSQNKLINKYNITEFPTFIFTDSRGGEYDRILGYPSKLSFENKLKEALIPADVEYNIQIDINKNLALIECTLKNIRQKSLILRLREESVEPISISLRLERIKDAENNITNIWKIDFGTSQMKTFSIKYVISPLNVLSSVQYSPMYISYVGDKYGILDGHMLFLEPYDFHLNGKIKVILNLPNGWKALTPWEEESPLTFSADYIQEVADSVFCIGQFQSIKREINGKEVYAVYCGLTNIGTELDRKADMVEQIFKDYIKRFGDFPFKKYIAIYAEHTPDGKYILGSAHGLGFAGPIEMTSADTSELTAHEIFHIWNGHILNQKSPYEVWFKEGFTQYYGYITPYRVGLYGKEQFEYHLKTDYQKYLKIYEAGEDYALSKINEPTARIEKGIKNFIMYSKSALVASMMDDEITKITNGKKNLDDLIRYMLIEYRDKEYRHDDVLKSLNAVTGNDFTKFFLDFVHGKEKIPLPEKIRQKG